MTNLGYTPEEPVVAVATALAPGAIAVVRCSGKNCIELVSKVFSRPSALLQAAGNTLVYGWIVDKSSAEDGSAENGRRIDEVMLGVYRAPKSFTGEDMVEIFCHGGLSVVSAVLSVLLANGFRQAQKGEFTFRAYINGKSDLTKAEAVKEIIDSKTDFSRQRAAGRLAGSLFAEIDSIKKLVVDTLASIEVGIEYPEDEENIADSFDETPLVEACQRLESLASSWKSEKLYQDGVRAVLCGKTNAGKSSLFNAMLKEERAIVSDVEGTTRDFLESWLSVEGLPVRLFDTAGLRATDDVVEAAGVERTRDLSKEADVILYVVDSTCGLCDEDRAFLALQKNIPVIVVWNKCDSPLSKKAPEDKLWKALVSVSAKDGRGTGELATVLRQTVCASAEGAREGVALGSERQKDSVCEALERIRHALDVSKNDYGLDAVVQDLEDSLDSLGEVTGQITPDDVLGSIFANFCVGK